MSKEPYYIVSQDASDFLRHYQMLYEGDYQRKRSSAISALIPNTSTGKVLDLGCGGGNYSLNAERKGWKDIVVLDFSFVCVKAARVNLSENTGMDVHSIRADATKLPFQSDCFDLVLCIDLIEHIWRDDLLLNQIARVLRPEGKLLIATQNSSSLNYFLEGFIQRGILKNRGWMGWDSTHVRFYNHKSLSRLLSSQGFELVKTAGTYFIPYQLANVFQRVSPRLSKGFYFLLKRINDVLEQLGHRRPLNKYGWGIFYLCVKKR